jgi:hypothetical protein
MIENVLGYAFLDPEDRPVTRAFTSALRGLWPPHFPWTTRWP